MQLFRTDAKIFLSKSFFFGHNKLKKTQSKVAQKYSKKISPIAAKTAQTEDFMFQNVTNCI